MGIKYATVDDTVWPVDLDDEDSSSAEWLQRYGTTNEREAQRLTVASVLAAYASLTDPSQSQKDALAKLRRARKATAAALLERQEKE